MCVSYLHLHCFYNTRWKLYIFDFITQAADSPLVCRLVDGVDDAGIKRLPFFGNHKGSRFKGTEVYHYFTAVSHTHKAVQIVSYPEYFIHGEFAQFRRHCGLCKLSHSIFWILYTITSLERHTTDQPLVWVMDTHKSNWRHLLAKTRSSLITSNHKPDFNKQGRPLSALSLQSQINLSITIFLQ